MRVLVACEFSGRVRQAFRRLGHDAWSCDLLPALDNSQYHYQQDVFNILINDWDLVIAHPPCTYLCSSGLHWNIKRPERAALTEEALEFFLRFVGCAPKVCIENPVGCVSTRFRKPDQAIQPFMFGEDASKKTCLWLENLPRLQETNFISGRLIEGVYRWSNQTNSGQNKLGPSPERAALRSITYQGIADAMATQWGGSLEGLGLDKTTI